MNKRVLKKSRGANRAQADMSWFPQDSPGTAVRILVGKPGGEEKMAVPPGFIPFL